MLFGIFKLPFSSLLFPIKPLRLDICRSTIVFVNALAIYYICLTEIRSKATGPECSTISEMIKKHSERRDKRNIIARNRR